MTGNEILILSSLGASGLSDMLNALHSAGLETKTMFPDQHFFTGKESIIASRTPVCIIFADTREFLEKLAMVKNRLYRLKVLVIVPEESEITIKAAHLLRPRLVRAAGGDYSDIAEIAARMRKGSLGGVQTAGNAKKVKTKKIWLNGGERV